MENNCEVNAGQTHKITPREADESSKIMVRQPTNDDDDVDGRVNVHDLLDSCWNVMTEISFIKKHVGWFWK